MPLSSTATILSASPSWAIPRSAFVDNTVFLRSARFSSTGSGGRPGNLPSGFALRVMTLQPILWRTRGVMLYAGPFAQSTTTLSFAWPTPHMIRSMCLSTASTRICFVPTASQGLSLNFLEDTAFSICLDCSTSNPIPSGFQSLMPAYSGGLWLAVIMPPAHMSLAASARVGVVTRPAE